ncbi:hemolysin family protein [Comamonas sediminis]|uniref:hemolysin family protein n=1 Tax=Comamonas sediminis TaxID=1783360 RepID=UPI003D2CB661
MLDVLLIALLTLLNGVFAMSELALASSRKSRLLAMAESGDKGAKAALDLLSNPTQFLSSIQVGITSIGMLNGIFGEAAFSDGLAQSLVTWGMPASVASVVATTTVIIVITFMTIVFGELVPKRIGQMYPEASSRIIALPLTWVSKIAKPFVWLLAISAQGVLKLLRIKDESDRAVTEEEIVASLDEGRDAGVIERHEHQMVQNVFHLDDRPLISMMVPRGDVEWLDANLNVTQALHEVRASSGKGAHSWYPVCRESLDNVVGLVSVAHLLDVADPQNTSIAKVAVAASYVPETLSGFELLEQFRARAGRMIFVVDEYGVVQGIITPRDLLEAITGELKPGAASEAWAVQNDDGSWYLDGLMPVSELKARLEIKELPDEDKGRYNTLAGMLMAESGHLPPLGEKIYCAGWVFEVLALEGKRVDKVIARPDLTSIDY